jgi:multidrug resistance efflux pump
VAKGVQRALRWSLILSGIVAVGFIPTPYQVGGEVTLEWPEGARQQVRPPRRAIVESFYVQPGDTVQVGQPLLQLSSLELDAELAETEEKIARAQELLREAERDQLQAQANWQEAQARVQAAQAQAARYAQRLQQLQQGQITPEIAALTVRHQRLTGKLQDARRDWERYQELYDAGAIAEVDMQAKEAVYYDVERDLQATAAEIEQAQQRLADMVVEEQGDVAAQQASVAAAATMAQATDRIAAHQATIDTLQQRLEALQQQDGDLVVVAQQTGTVLDEDLDLIVGQEVTPEDPLLSIAQLDTLTANVQVKEEDSGHVDIGAEVTFRPTSAKLTTYDAEVDKILPNLEPDQTQQRRIATVRVVIDNEDGRLQPGSGGYAKIFSEWIPLYERLGRELIKLVPSRFL